MINYIDADKLQVNTLNWRDINDLERIINNVHYEFRNGIGEKAFGEEVLERFREERDEQEQQEPSNNLVDVDAVREDFITEVYRILDADPTNDRANAIIDAFDSLPTVSQEQPVVDLEKLKNKAELIANGIMIGVQANKYHTCIYDKASNDFNHSHLLRAALKGIEIGLNAKKEETL